MHLTQDTEPRGAHLEYIVLHDLMAWRDSKIERVKPFYWRSSVGEAVDFVVEAVDSLLPIEVKPTTMPRYHDAAHRRTFFMEYGDRSKPGILLNAGKLLDWLTLGVLAASCWWVLVGDLG